MGHQPGEAARAVSKRTAQTIRERYGADFYQRIGSHGGTTTLARHGIEHYYEIGNRGGTAFLERYGVSRYVAMGEQSAAMKKQRKEQGHE